jgi:hypothetical protein
MGFERFNPSSYGIFADSEALGAIDEVETAQHPDYYSKSRPCEVCNTRKECRMSWAELYCLKNGVLPHRVGQAIRREDLFGTQWNYSPKFQCFHPNYRCSCDPRALVLFDITPTEAERMLHQAGRNGVISPSQRHLIQAITPVVAQLIAPHSPPGV